jgi:hypothetical protein
VRSIYERFKDKIPGLIEIRDENVGITPLMVSTFHIVPIPLSLSHHQLRQLSSPALA